MNTLGLLMRKELLYQWRTYRLLIFLLLGISVSLLAYSLEFGARSLFTLIKESTPAGVDLSVLADLLSRPPTLVGLSQRYLENIFLLSAGVVLIGGGGFAQEIQSGELTPLWSRPLPRFQIVLTRWAAATFSAFVGLFCSAILYLLFTSLHFETPKLLPFLQVLMCLGISLAVYTAIVVLASTLSRGTAMTIGIAGGGLLATQAFAFLPFLSRLSPHHPAALASTLAFGLEASLSPAWVYSVAALWMAGCLLLATWVLTKREV